MNNLQLKEKILNDENFSKQISFKLREKKGREEFINWVSGFGSKWHDKPTPTPYSLVEKIVDKTVVNQKNILILFNLEFLEFLIFDRNISPNKIYFIADNEVKRQFAEKVYKVNAFIAPYELGCVNLRQLIERI